MPGGLGVAKDMYVGGNLNVASGIQFTDTTDSTHKDTCAMVLEGGMGVDLSAWFRSHPRTSQREQHANRPGAYLPRDDDGDKAGHCSGWACGDTNFRAPPGGCYCCCIIGERTGDSEEGECTFRINSAPM
eukprot:jgi/Tetstr1/465733/TSEL_010358.t1